jgi:hypothetical protein
MIHEAVKLLSKEPSMTAKMVAEKAMQDTYGINPPYAEDGVFPHLKLFARLLMAEVFDVGDEETIHDPLPGEDVLSTATRLRGRSLDLAHRADVLARRL